MDALPPNGATDNSAAPAATQGMTAVDLTPFQDVVTPLANPFKGWYHHFPDNGFHKYVIRDDRELTEFPGMDHLYMRLAWSYLEPREGAYAWHVIDDIADAWRAKGLGIAFRISCRETGTEPVQQKFATPQWVPAAGAKGGHYRRGGTPGDPALPWEPIYDDPVYLEKLEAFVAAFAARYDGKSWLRYVDIGGIGDWGEAHTSHGSNLVYDRHCRQRHMELYRKHFTRTLLVAPDEMTDKEPTAEGQDALHRYIVDHGITYRDDSILVDWFVQNWPETASVKHPDYFDDVFRDRPTILELQHYPIIKKDGNWRPDPGSALAEYGGTGPDFFRRAVDLMHATYIGYHGDAREWLDDNPELTGELLNRCGYLYVPHRAEWQAVLRPGSPTGLCIAWENRGAAPAYHDAQLTVRFRGAAATRECTVPSGNRRWMPAPGTTVPETYRLELPPDLPEGPCELAIKLRSPQAGRDIALALRTEIRDEDGFYRLGTARVSRA